MDRHSVESSSLKSVGYDATQHVLEVEFEHGAVYRYTQVPARVYDELMSADSKGRFLNNEIKKAYPTERVK